MPEEILELSALAPVRPKARIKMNDADEGTIYDLAVPDDFGAVTLRKMGLQYEEVGTILASDKDPSKAQEKRLNMLLDQIVGKIIPDAPAAEIKALPFVQKQAVVVRFFGELGEQTITMLGEHGKRLLAQSTSEN